MINLPKTLEEAKARMYGGWAGNRKGYPYLHEICAYEVHDRGRNPLFHQCNNSNGHGPDGLYCKAHAKKVEGDMGAAVTAMAASATTITDLKAQVAALLAQPTIAPADLQAIHDGLAAAAPLEAILSPVQPGPAPASGPAPTT